MSTHSVKKNGSGAPRYHQSFIPVEVQPQLVDPSLFISLLWFWWVVFWLLASRGVKKVRVVESASTRATYLLPKIFTAMLLFSRFFQFGVLRRRFIPHVPAVEWTGVALTALGIAFTIWARVHIGRNWSARVVIKEQHELVRSGPYRLVRHPIYTGLLIAIAGTALVIGEWRAVLALAFAIVGFTAKAKREEDIMTNEFGEEYVRYRQQTGMLIPKLR